MKLKFILEGQSNKTPKELSVELAVVEEKQTTAGNQMISLQSELRGVPAVRGDTKRDAISERYFVAQRKFNEYRDRANEIKEIMRKAKSVNKAVNKTTPSLKELRSEMKQVKTTIKNAMQDME